MASQICTAIQNMNLLSFTYDGFDRIVEPHACGNDKKGNDVLRAFQVGGGSESGDATGWKLFVVSNIRNLKIQKQTFSSPRQGYRPGDKVMQRIYCQL